MYLLLISIACDYFVFTMLRNTHWACGSSPPPYFPFYVQNNSV